MIIVSRHSATIEWLHKRGYTGTVVAHATPELVEGETVVGNLPLHLASLTTMVGIVELPNLTREMRGRDLSQEEMKAAGARLRWYHVNAIE